jgi:cytochrome c oxidase cbb3-type subunit III
MIQLMRRWGHTRPAVIGLVITLVFVGIPLGKGLAADRTGGNTGQESAASVSDEQDSKRLLMARCAVCHSTDLIVQQRLTLAQWLKTLNKMERWGAQVSSAEQTQLANYLAARYPPGASRSLEQTAQDSLEAPFMEPTIHPGMPEHPEGRPDHGQSLFGQNCVPCHGPAAAGGMGPKLAKNPILTDERRFWATVRQGRGAMPGWSAMLNAQEIADIQAWLKTLE